MSMKYFKRLSFGIIVPSILLTTMGSVGSFLTASSFISEEVKVGINIAIGIGGIFSTMLQSLGSSLQFDVKITSHQRAADEYNNILVRLKNEIEIPNEEGFADEIEAKIMEIQTNCGFYPPQWIIEQFSQDYEKQNREKEETYESSYHLDDKQNTRIKVNNIVLDPQEKDNQTPSVLEMTDRKKYLPKNKETLIGNSK